MAKFKPLIFHGFLALLLLSLPLSALDLSIHDILRSKGLPAGLLPRAIRSYTLDQSGRLEVVLDRPCLTKFETRVFYESVVTANLTYAALKDVVGLSQEELFLWLPVKDIIVDDPESGLILFDIGVAHKQLSISLFDDPPVCHSDGDGDGNGDAALTLPSGHLWESGRKETGSVAQR